MYTITPEFGWVLLSAIAIGFSCLFIGLLFPWRARAKAFTEQYMKENYGTEHLRLTQEEIKKGGYPDTGSGLYSNNLTYEQWYNLNNAQRAHLNFVEWVSANIIFLVVGGIYYPIVASAFGFGIAVSRLIYAIGYVMRGPDGRLLGAILNDLITLAQFVLAIMSSAQFIGGGNLF